MARPAVEVADIFRDHGAAWRRANAGHVGLDQLKVMSAIERCRTAAPPYLPRVRSLAAFGRRPPVDVARLSMAGIRNPAQKRPGYSALVCLLPPAADRLLDRYIRESRPLRLLQHRRAEWHEK
jgi:hypothetical protein